MKRDESHPRSALFLAGSLSLVHIISCRETIHAGLAQELKIAAKSEAAHRAASVKK